MLILYYDFQVLFLTVNSCTFPYVLDLEINAVRLPTLESVLANTTPFIFVPCHIQKTLFAPVGWCSGSFSVQYCNDS